MKLFVVASSSLFKKTGGFDRGPESGTQMAAYGRNAVGSSQICG